MKIHKINTISLWNSSQLHANMKDLESLKYSELQKLAKKLGIKANQKADKIIIALRELSDQSLPGNLTADSERECTTTTTDSEPEEKAVRKTKKSSRSRKTKKAALPQENLTSEDERPESQPKKPKATPKLLLPSKPTPKLTPREQIKAKFTPKATSALRKTPGLYTPQALSSPGLPARCTSTPRVLPSSTKRAASRLSDANTPKTALKPPIPSSTSQKPSRVTPAQAGKRRSRSCDVMRPARKSNSSLMSEDDEVVIKSKRRSRSNTFTRDAPSPSVKGFLDSMTEDMTDEQQKESLMAALDKKVDKQQTLKRQSSKTNIPRYNGPTAKSDTSGEAKKKTPGKDWSKIHKRQWDKMESLDEYLAKKRKRTESLTQSVKKMRLTAEQMKVNIQSLKKPKTPASTKKASDSGKVIKPANQPKAALFQSPGAVFKPKVTSTSNLNFNFGAMYGKEQRGIGKMKTPTVTARKSPRQAVSGKKSGTQPLFTIGRSGGRKSGVTASISKENMHKKSSGRKSIKTPFKSNDPVNTSDITANRQKFDIKESLSKDITWKTHKGKLKPFSFGSLYNHETEVKKVKVKSRDDRRKEHKQRITEKRKNAQMSQRVINA